MSVVTFTKVKLPNGWLGNMAPYPLEYEGVTYRTSEALFQALRFALGPIREVIMGAKMVAKRQRRRAAALGPRRRAHAARRSCAVSFASTQTKQEDPDAYHQQRQGTPGRDCG